MVRRRNLVIGLGVAVLAFTLSLAHSWATERRVADRIRRTPVVVVRRALKAGTRLTPEMLSVRRIPVDELLPGAFRTLPQAVGRSTTVPLWPKDQVIAGRTTSADGRDAGQALSHDERGLLVPVEGLLAKTLQPGEWVDLVVVSPESGGPSRVIPAARVLRVGGRDDLLGSQPCALVAVPVSEAQALAAAADGGRIQVVLRGRPPDGGPTRPGQGARLQQLVGTKSHPGVRPEVRTVKTVEVIRGVESEEHPRSEDKAPSGLF